MKKVIEEIVSLDKIVIGGQSLGVLLDGRKVFVWGALPHETARIEIFKMKKSYAEAIATKIIESSPDRIPPRDDCFLSTSPWQILDFAAENRHKEQLVRDAFAQEKIDLKNICEIKTDGRDFFYRNKMEYSLWWDNDLGKISLAFHRRGSHQKIPISESSIERPEIFREAQRIVAKLNSEKAEARKFQSLLVRANQNGEVSSALFENGKPHPRMKNLSDTILGREYSYSPNGFFQINLPVYEMALAEISNEILRGKNEKCHSARAAVRNEQRSEESQKSARLDSSKSKIFQNDKSEISREKNEDFAENLGRNSREKIVDMYSGVGSIGLSLTDEKREIILVETDKNAFLEMQNNVKNLPKNLAKNVRAIHAKSEESLEFIARNSVLILDPPRAGLDEKLVAKIREIRPKKIVYLSCNPATQARDVAKILGISRENSQKSDPCHSEQSEGSQRNFRDSPATPIASRPLRKQNDNFEKESYEIAKVQPFNFFPRTPHIENLIVLELK